MKKIVLDCLGGDKGLPAMVTGAVTALKRNPKLQLVLVGDSSLIQPQVAEFGERVEIVDTKVNIAMDEHPTTAIRTKVDSSLVLGLEQLRKRDDCGAFVSAGSTGAVLTGGFMKIGRIAGVSRPALCPFLPTMIDGQEFMLLDAGANMDCTAVQLVQFAVMADAYKKAMGMQSPRIALLNVGTEETKGNEVVKQAHAMLTKLRDAKLINFVGNIEPEQAFKGQVDIVVADGFWGNVLLKTTEGTVKFIFKSLKNIMLSSLSGKIGALFLGKKLKKFKAEKTDKTNATIFLGLKKSVVKMHGNADARKVTSALEYAMTVADLDLNQKIEQVITQIEPMLGENA
ncbi:MAG: phosphate acyltransferase PlsX [Clostridia bacterium]|nr:phosphate acyltransferase PlsX [Clostridia bacterium]